MNTSLSKRENFRQTRSVTGTTQVINKSAGAIMGLYLDLSTASTITWEKKPFKI